jgi:hypothetical protein
MPQGFGLGAILRVIRGMDEAPVAGKAITAGTEAASKAETQSISPQEPGLDTHLLCGRKFMSARTAGW